MAVLSLIMYVLRNISVSLNGSIRMKQLDERLITK